MLFVLLFYFISNIWPPVREVDSASEQSCCAVGLHVWALSASLSKTWQMNQLNKQEETCSDATFQSLHFQLEMKE